MSHPVAAGGENVSPRGRRRRECLTPWPPEEAMSHSVAAEGGNVSPRGRRRRQCLTPAVNGTTLDVSHARCTLINRTFTSRLSMCSSKRIPPSGPLNRKASGASFSIPERSGQLRVPGVPGKPAGLPEYPRRTAGGAPGPGSAGAGVWYHPLKARYLPSITEAKQSRRWSVNGPTQGPPLSGAAANICHRNATNGRGLSNGSLKWSRDRWTSAGSSW